eukprot:tig00000093_g3567.t1
MSSGAAKRGKAEPAGAASDAKPAAPAKEYGPLTSLVHLAYAGVAAAIVYSSPAAPLVSPRGAARFVTAGLIYDNLILGIGRWIWRSPALHKALSWFRFPLHLLGLPTLLFTAVDLANGSPDARFYTALLFGVCFLMGLQRISVLKLGIKNHWGVVSVSSALPHPGDGLAPVVAVTACLIAGGHVWRGAGWPWLLLASAAVFVGVGLPVPRDLKGLVINFFELVFCAALAACPSLSP